LDIFVAVLEQLQSFVVFVRFNYLRRTQIEGTD